MTGASSSRREDVVFLRRWLEPRDAVAVVGMLLLSVSSGHLSGTFRREAGGSVTPENIARHAA
ncbi:signal peptidase I [Microbacterium testaceum StLB037]|uniref:Signal peptidase I n=1 Tax=Microbacterium testaceum (strain StLB037) TaxID=979556 RepID=E8NA90_MICTS|nr:signal peptidase I [Microbacterium testaceum StLB037]